MGSISRDYTSNIEFSSICTNKEPTTVKKMDFTPESEEEFIREALSHKLDRPLVNPSNKVWRDSNQTKDQTSFFQICDSLIYTNKEQNEMADLVDVNKNDTDSIKYIIKFLRGNTMVITKESQK